MPTIFSDTVEKEYGILPFALILTNVINYIEGSEDDEDEQR